MMPLAGFMPAVVEYPVETAPQSGDRRWEADHYRERARALRVLAWRTRSSEARRELLALASRHERLADYVEAHRRDRLRAREDAAD